MKLVVLAWVVSVIAVAFPVTNLTIFDKNTSDTVIGASPPLAIEAEPTGSYSVRTEQEIVDAVPTTTHIDPTVARGVSAEEPLCDGLGHCWRWGAWRNPDDSAWVEHIPIPTYSSPATTSFGYVPSAAPSTCPAIISSTFGWAGCAISFCESGWNPNAVGDSGRAWGYFQIRSDFHHDATFDPAGNVAAAYRISGGGSSWGAWSVRSVLSTGVCPNSTVVPS